MMSVSATFASIGALCAFAGASLLIPMASSLTQLPPAKMQPLPANLLYVETNGCGAIDELLNRRSASKGLRADDPQEDDDDEDAWVNAWGMSPEESLVMNQWLLKHADTATITEAVEKSCDGESAPIDTANDVEFA